MSLPYPFNPEARADYGRWLDWYLAEYYIHLRGWLQ